MLFEQDQMGLSDEARTWAAAQTWIGFTERLVGVVSFSWDFIAYMYAGSSTRKQAFALFDDVMVGIVHQAEGISAGRVKVLLGLDGGMGEKVYRKMVDPLMGSMLQGDDSYLVLTEKGKVYARMGSKYEVFQGDFTLLSNVQMPWLNQPQKLLDSLPNVLAQNPNVQLPELESELPWADLEKVEQQASKMHLPSKGFFMDKALLKEARVMSREIKFAIVENYAENKVYLIPFDPKSLQRIEEVDAALREGRLKEIEEAVVAQFRAEEGQALGEKDKSEGQMMEEAWRVEVANDLKVGQVGAPDEEKPVMAERQSFGTFEFEKELERLLKTCKGELWLISPWVRHAAIERREKLLRDCLRSGTHVFIGYSAPFKEGEIMMETKAKGILKDLNADYPNLHVAELPAFHEKAVLALYHEREKAEYVGSYNVLSFSPRPSDKVSREQMRRLPWGEESDRCRSRFMEGFAEHSYKLLEGKVQRLLKGDKTYKETKDELKRAFLSVQGLLQKADPEWMAKAELLEVESNNLLQKKTQVEAMDRLKAVALMVEELSIGLDTLNEAREKVGQIRVEYKEMGTGLQEEGQRLLEVIGQKRKDRLVQVLKEDWKKAEDKMTDETRRRFKQRIVSLQSEYPMLQNDDDFQSLQVLFKAASLGPVKREGSGKQGNGGGKRKNKKRKNR